MNNIYRFTKTHSRYASQIIWLADKRKFSLHPLQYTAETVITIDQEKIPIDWKDLFRTFGFASIFDLATWIHEAIYTDDVFMLQQLPEIINAAGFRFDTYVIEEFDFLYNMQHAVKEQTYRGWIALADEKNVPLRVLVQLAKTFLPPISNEDKTENKTTKKKNIVFVENSEYFFANITSLFLQDYIKNNSVRELLKMLTDISLEKKIQITKEMKALQEQTHFDNRNRLNYFYYELVQKYRYPLFATFSQEIETLQKELLKKQKNVLLQFHPAYEKSEFTLQFVIKKEKDIEKAKKFFDEKNIETLRFILDKLLQG